MLIQIIVECLSMLIPALLGVAYLTLVERKVLAAMQHRQGPMVTGILGLFQPIADAVKLLTKESIIPRVAKILLFIISPMLIFSLSLSGWVVIPISTSQVLADVDLGLLYIFAISSFSVYGIIVARLG